MVKLTVVVRYPCAVVGVHRAVVIPLIYRTVASFPPTEGGPTSYPCDDRLGLDATLDFHRGPADMVTMGRGMGERGRC